MADIKISEKFEDSFKAMVAQHKQAKEALAYLSSMIEQVFVMTTMTPKQANEIVGQEMFFDKPEVE